MAALAGVIAVVIWEITNDRIALTEETRGLLRMRTETPVTGDEQE